MTTSHKSPRLSTLMGGFQKEQQFLLRPNQRQSKHSMSPRSPLASLRLGGLLRVPPSPTSQLCLIILLLTIVQATVRCQDFEDLISQNSKPGGNAGGNLQFPPLQQLQQNFQASRQGPQSTFSSSSSVAQSSSQFQPQAAPQQQANSRQSTFQRPVLSTRFASSSSSQQQQTTTGQQQQPSSIEQIMKNALARTSRVEQSAGPEARQDMAQESIQSRSGAQFQPGQAQADAGTPMAPQQPNQTGRREQVSSRSSAASEKSADSSEALASTQPADEFADKQTTAGGDQAVNFNNGHETNFTDARFANLFARRNNLKRVKFTPMEQVKAKPTLPSFIKSPPDPKQFNRNGQLDSDLKPLTQASTNLVSARLQQQPGQRAQLSAQVNKNRANAGITSNTAAAANNKRAQAQKPLAVALASPPKVTTGSSSSKATGTQAGPSTSRPVSNNPFNKSQQQNSDQASVIAMARRRLLANNALKEQQQKATTTSI